MAFSAVWTVTGKGRHPFQYVCIHNAESAEQLFFNWWSKKYAFLSRWKLVRLRATTSFPRVWPPLIDCILTSKSATESPSCRWAPEMVLPGEASCLSCCRLALPPFSAERKQAIQLVQCRNSSPLLKSVVEPLPPPPHEWNNLIFGLMRQEIVHSGTLRLDLLKTAYYPSDFCPWRTKLPNFNIRLLDADSHVLSDLTPVIDVLLPFSWSCVRCLSPVQWKLTPLRVLHCQLPCPATRPWVCSGSSTDYTNRVITRTHVVFMTSSPQMSWSQPLTQMCSFPNTTSQYVETYTALQLQDFLAILHFIFCVFYLFAKRNIFQVHDISMRNLGASARKLTKATHKIHTSLR